MKRLKTALFYLLFGPLIAIIITLPIEVVPILISEESDVEFWIVCLFFTFFGYSFGATPAAIAGWIIRDAELRYDVARARKLSFLIGFVVSFVFFVLFRFVSDYWSFSKIMQLDVFLSLILIGLIGGASAYILTSVRHKFVIRNELQ